MPRATSEVKPAVLDRDAVDDLRASFAGALARKPSAKTTAAALAVLRDAGTQAQRIVAETVGGRSDVGLRTPTGAILLEVVLDGGIHQDARYAAAATLAVDRLDHEALVEVLPRLAPAFAAAKPGEPDVAALRLLWTLVDSRSLRFGRIAEERDAAAVDAVVAIGDAVRRWDADHDGAFVLGHLVPWLADHPGEIQIHGGKTLSARDLPGAIASHIGDRRHDPGWVAAACGCSIDWRQREAPSMVRVLAPHLAKDIVAHAASGRLTAAQVSQLHCGDAPYPLMEAALAADPPLSPVLTAACICATGKPDPALLTSDPRTVERLVETLRADPVPFLSGPPVDSHGIARDHLLATMADPGARRILSRRIMAVIPADDPSATLATIRRSALSDLDDHDVEGGLDVAWSAQAAGDLRHGRTEKTPCGLTMHEHRRVICVTSRCAMHFATNPLRGYGRSPGYAGWRAAFLAVHEPDLLKLADTTGVAWHQTYRSLDLTPEERLLLLGRSDPWNPIPSRKHPWFAIMDIPQPDKTEGRPFAEIVADPDHGIAVVKAFAATGIGPDDLMGRLTASVPEGLEHLLVRIAAACGAVGDGS